MSNIRSIDSDGEAAPASYNPQQVRNDCRNTGIYCVVSVILLIVAFEISNPDVMNALPGGPVTSMIIGIAIIIAVIVLCYWQRPRRS